MGLFSNKKAQADGFSFAVDEVYALKEGKSVVVTGKMTEGKVTPGTAAICLDSEGKLAFHCVIKGIEQGTQLMKMASADMKGTYGPHYGFKLDGAVKEDVPKGAVLVPVTDELLEVVSETEEPAFKATPAPKVIDFNRISGLTMEDLQGVPEENENDLEAVKKAGERDENLAALLPKKREDELSALVAGEGTLSEALLVPLSVKECIFMICRLQQMNEQAEMPDYNEKGQLLYDAVVEKLKMSSSLYILLDKGTGLPYIIEGTVDVYSEEILAKHALHFYENQYHKSLILKEVPKKNSGLPGRISLFAWLYYLGMEKLLINNGSYQLLMNRSDFLEDPSEEKGAELPVPVSNPALRFEMADLLGEVRWPVSYPEREEKIAAKKNAVLNELVKSKLLVPVKYNGDLNVGQNSLSAEQGQGLILPRITNKQKKAFLPLFTDWMEFEKAYKRNDWGCVVFSMADAIRATGGDNIVINPLAENLVLDREDIKEIINIYKNVK